MFLVLDAGTTGTRAVLIDTLGQIQGLAYREYINEYLENGVINQDPWTWWKAVLAVVPQVLTQTGIAPSEIHSISVTSQRATIFPVNSRGEPLRPAILWQDKRTLPQCHQLEEHIGEQAIYQMTGLRIDPYFSLPKIMWFKQEASDAWKSTYTFLTVHDWIVFQLTGRFGTDLTQASRTQLLDIDDRQWADNLAHEVGVDDVSLPDLYPTGSVIGTLTAHAASLLGLIQGIPVVMAGGDQQSAAVGLNVIRQGQVKITTGTGSFIVAPVEQPVIDEERRLLCSISAVPNQWILEAGIFTTGAVLRWWRDELADWAVTESNQSGRDAYELITELASSASLGSRGALLIPHFAGSAAPYWNAGAEGILFGLSQNQTKADLARSILEGIAFEIDKNLAIIEQRLSIQGNAESEGGLDTSIPSSEGGKFTSQMPVHVTGGLTRSDLFNQIQADVYGHPVVPSSTEQATSLGAAVVASVATGVYKEFSVAAQAMSHMDENRVFQPVYENHVRYQRLQGLHHQIYTALHEASIYELAANVHKTLDSSPKL